MEEEIDLRIYIDILLRWWWLIVLGGVLAAGAALVGQSMQTPKYQAVAGVVSLRSRAEISLGSSFQTVTEEDLANMSSNMVAQRSQQRLNTLAGMVRNGAIAQQVSEELAAALNEEERDPASLIGRVRGEVLELEGGGSSDTIQVVVTHPDPQKAALVANAWAKAYERYVNDIYGEASLSPFDDIQNQITGARAEYDEAQDELLTFLTEDDRIYELERQIQEEETIIANLRTARQTAISAVVDKEVQVKQQLITAYMEDDISNRLFAFSKGQEANRKILGTWIDAEVTNRVNAIERDRNMRLELFNTLVDAELDTRMQVFNLEHESQLQTLTELYSRTLRLEGLLAEAQLMREQLAQGGEASASSNGLALLAFKSKVFSTSDNLPFETLDLQITSVDALSPNLSAAEQIADLDALIVSLEAELEDLAVQIDAQSELMLAGAGYEFLPMLSPDFMALSGASNGAAETAAISGTLSDFIGERYADLFEMGEIALSATAVATDTALFAEIQNLYPELFAKDPWKDLSSSIPKQTELGQLATQMAQELLQLQGMENLLSYSTLDTPLSQEIGRREADVRALQADISRLEQIKTDLQQKRDMAWQAYSTLLSTAQEINIASASESSEVRFASPALPPRSPTGPSNTMVLAVGAAAGLMLGVFGAFLFDYIGMESTPRYVWGQVVQVGASTGQFVQSVLGKSPPADDDGKPPESETHI